MKLKSLLYEYHNNDTHQIAQQARSRGYTYKSYRGDISHDEITVYSSKDRREHGIFTTPVKEIADIYAGSRGSGNSRLFYIKALKILDLTQDTLQNMRWVEEWGESFDEWIDKQSGEEMSAWDVLSGGQMFDYEGDWSSERWMDIQATAENQGYDAIVLPDYDSSIGIFPSFVVFDEKNLKLADETTYDDKKNPIPLEQRFNNKVDDIRY